MKGFIIALCLLGTLASSAQQYNSAVGIRGGGLNSVTYKQTLNDYSAVEFIASTYRRGLLLTGLYTLQNDFTIEGEPFQWYYGGGAHLGLFNSNELVGDGSSTKAVIGVDAIIGIEYTFREIPLNLSLDYKPALNLLGSTNFWADHASLGIRYVID